MRQLTFNRFLEQYLLYVSHHNSLSIHKLAVESKKNYRLRDSLVLYCALSDKKNLLNKYMRDVYARDLEGLNEKNFLDDRYSNYEFRKIWRSYQNIIDKNQIDIDAKGKIREIILNMMKEKGITNYRVYTDLKLNPGNANAFLSNGDCTKVSLNTAMKISEYIKNYQATNNK